MCNPKFPTHNWKIAKLEERHGSRYATIIVNQESLENLAKSNGVVAFEFEHIILKVYKKDNRPMESSDNAPQENKPQDEHMSGSDEEEKEGDNLTAFSTQIHSRSRVSSFSSTG